MRLHRRMWESGHTTRYHQWNHTCTRSADNQQRTNNHIELPSRQVSSLISNGVFNIDAPANGAIRLNKKLYAKYIYIRYTLYITYTEIRWRPAVKEGRKIFSFS